MSGAATVPPCTSALLTSLSKSAAKAYFGLSAGAKPENHAAVRSLLFGPHWAVPVLPATFTFGTEALPAVPLASDTTCTMPRFTSFKIFGSKSICERARTLYAVTILPSMLCTCLTSRVW